MGIIAWIDTETTGLDPFTNPIIEFALVVTTDRRGLDQITSKSWLVRPRDIDAAVAQIEEAPRVLEMHTANGLLDELKAGAGQPRAEVEQEVIEILNRSNPGRGRVPMGGSGVERFESHFLAHQFPLLSQQLHYWSYDIGNVRRVARLCGVVPPESTSVAKSGTHRALDDVLQHIEETRWFMRFFQAMKAEGVLHDLSREDSNL